MYIITYTMGIGLEQNHKKNRHNRLSNFMHILTAENPLSIQKYPLPSKPKHSLTLPTSFSSKLSPFPPFPSTAFHPIPDLSQTLTSFPFHPSTLFYPLLHNLSTPWNPHPSSFSFTTTYQTLLISHQNLQKPNITPYYFLKLHPLSNLSSFYITKFLSYFFPI